MTDIDDLVARLEAYNTPDRTVDEQRHIAAVIHTAAAALREQQAEIARLGEERTDWARRFLLNDVTPFEWMSRALRAETEADAEAEMTDEWRQRAEKAEAELADVKVKWMGQIGQCATLSTQIDRLEAERDDAIKELRSESSERLKLLRRFEEVASTLRYLEQAYANKHSPQHRAAALNSAQGVLASIDAAIAAAAESPAPPQP